ncbi:MAG: 2-hydroxyacyl-CoA dehydratase [Phycisphaerales bacterium]|nr:2-hydroxyacyl-CoA dehydratase [Phycisphaerales bacterium]MDP6889853.1 2-hydroxyacyl-CoA dehydratase [Phycisphaerales bacterium]
MTVFNEWGGEPLDEIMYHCRELVEDTTFPTIKRWREQGGKTLGHFQVYFPEELAHAAGMMPVKMCGTMLEPNNADSHFGSYLCSIIKTSLEAALSGGIELDIFVSHPICDAARNLAAIFGRNFDYPCQILYLPQNPNSVASADWLSQEYGRMRRLIEEIVGHEVSDEAISVSIEVFNENRRLMRELYEIKREAPWLVTADEAYALVAIGGVIPREEHNDLLSSVLPMLRERETRREDRIRVVFEGAFCEQPPLDLVRMLGRTCYVVDDDFLIGMRYLLEDVPVTDNPLLSLSEAYIEQSSYSPVQHDNRKPKEDMLLQRIKESRADAAIVAAAKMCEPGLEEQVAYIHMLDDEKIPYFVSEFEENMSSFDQLELQIETFLENILFA